MNGTCSNRTHEELVRQSKQIPLYVDVFVLMALLLSIIFLTAHLFLLYILKAIKSVKGKHFSSLTAALLMKYLLILLNVALRAFNITSSPNIIVLSFVYTHLAATCWLCVTTDYSLYLTKKRFLKTYNTRWISPGVTLVLGWVLPAVFTLLVYVCTLFFENYFCQDECSSCNSTVLYIVFEIVKMALLLKSAVDVVRFKYCTEKLTQAGDNSELVNESGYINYCITFCIVFYIIWTAEILGFYFVCSVMMIEMPVVGSVEALLVILVTLRGKNFLTSLSTGV